MRKMGFGAEGAMMIGTRSGKAIRAVVSAQILAFGALAGDEGAAASSAEALSILSDLVAIDTSPEKGTAPAVTVLHDYFIDAGFPEADVTVLANPEAPRYANLVVRLRGQGKVKPLLYMAHLDVVDARPEDWSLPPFNLTEQDGWLYGRGVLDMKGEVANVAAAMSRLHREDYTPPGDILAVFSPDEETRGPNGVVWLIKAHPALFDVRLVLNPDAPVAIFRHGARAYYGVQTSEKIYATFEVEATNPGGHSSEPRPDNAVYSLTAGLTRLANYRFPINLTQTVRAYYGAQARFATGTRKTDMMAVSRGDREAAERLSAIPADNAQVRTTCVTTMLDAGHAENALPQRAMATVQCRLVPGEDVEAVQTQLIAVLGDPGLQVRLRYADTPAPESEPTDEIMRTYERAVNGIWPGLPVVPVMDAGGSDSLYTRTAGLPTFGAPSIFVDFDDVRAHGRDERIRRERFTEGTELAYRIMKAFAE
jgi:acetylornithine deacetylase/succinyl-diaminopimelate desuccinylase-like protein